MPTQFSTAQYPTIFEYVERLLSGINSVNGKNIVGVLILDAHHLLEILPSDGEPISFGAAMTLLSERLGRPLSESDVHGFLWALGPRVTLDPAKSELRLILATPLPDRINAERDLEGWFERYLQREAIDRFFQYKPPSLSLVIENTARTGPPTGAFTQPDICMACVSNYHYSPIAHFDLFSFELKMQDGCNTRSVMQTANYKSFAHFSYLCVYLQSNSEQMKNIEIICHSAHQNGVGIVHIENPFQDDGYKIKVQAVRQNPEPGKIDKFIEDRFSEANRLILRKWVRS